MVALSTRRLTRWAPRADVGLTDGHPPLAPTGRRFDRFVATYVLDLLPDDDIAAMVQDAHRLLGEGGLLCLACLTHGDHGIPAVVSHLWQRAAAVAPRLTGGCRPLDVDRFVTSATWEVLVNETVVTWGVSSQVVIARPC